MVEAYDYWFLSVCTSCCSSLGNEKKGQAVYVGKQEYYDSWA